MDKLQSLVSQMGYSALHLAVVRGGSEKTLIDLLAHLAIDVNAQDSVRFLSSVLLFNRKISNYFHIYTGWQHRSDAGRAQAKCRVCARTAGTPKDQCAPH